MEVYLPRILSGQELTISLNPAEVKAVFCPSTASGRNGWMARIWFRSRRSFFRREFSQQLVEGGP